MGQRQDQNAGWLRTVDQAGAGLGVKLSFVYVLATGRR
jgi:hypothetical protein